MLTVNRSEQVVAHLCRVAQLQHQIGTLETIARFMPLEANQQVVLDGLYWRLTYETYRYYLREEEENERN
jgi:hypothetical protein